MAISPTKICNYALVILGEKRIAALTQDSETARTCNEIYEQIRDEVLADGPEKGWKFARARKTVSVSSDTPEFEFAYQFAVPSDPPCLQIVSVQVDGTELTDWQKEGDYILTNEEDTSVDVIYIKQVTDEAKFPPHFVKYFAATLAVELSYKITQNSAMGERLLTRLERAIRPRAIAKDAKESYVEEENDDWIAVGHTRDK